MTGASPAAADPATDPLPANRAQQELRRSADAAPTVVTDRAGRVRTLVAKPGKPVRSPVRAGAKPEAAAAAFLKRYGQAFGLLPGHTVRQTRSEELPGGQRAVRFRQHVGGLPVIGGDLTVLVDRSGNVVAANGETVTGAATATTARVDATTARGKAVGAAASKLKLNRNALAAKGESLWLYDARVLGAPGREELRPVWRVEVRGPAASGENAMVLVDATDGSAALVVSGRKEARNRNVCDLRNARVSFDNLAYGCTTALTPVRREGGAASSVVDVNKAYDYSGSTYDYYKAVFNRDSIDNNGMPLNSTVRACALELPVEYCPYGNAFWDGTQMVYGDGFASADDVVAHELTHGVTDHTSELLYVYQSGAINESLSDIFGELVDIYNGMGNDAASVRWQLGEDLPSWVGVIRNMANPPAYQQPDRMRSTLYVNDPDDNGGVHTNSGVGNKAAYLLTDGGTFNGQTITGLGLVKAAQIWYRVMYLLSSGSDYADLAGALTAACHSAVGVRGITEADCDQVAKVITAVEMTAQPTDPASQAPEAAQCDNAGQPTDDVFADDMENPQSGNWTLTGPWHYLTKEVDGFRFAHSGKYSLNFFVDTQAAAGTATMAEPVTIPDGTTYLWFAHVEFGTPAGSTAKPVYRENGGAWVDATPLIDAGARPDTAGSFTGDSHGWVSTRLNVSSLAGKTVQFGFDVTTNGAARYVDWYLDDVKLYQCAAKPGAVRDLVAQGRFGTANLTWAAPQYAGAGVDHYTVSASPAVDGLPTDVPADQLATNVTGLDPATAYTFTVKAVQADGTAGPGTTVSFSPVALTIAAAPSPVDYGANVTVTGTAKARESGEAMQFGTVWLYGRRTGTTAWNYVAAAEVTAQGGFTFSHATPAPYEYMVNYAGKNGWQGSSSNVVAVTQRPLVTAGWYPTTIRFGQSSTISGATEADRVNAQVILQVLHVDGVWRTATTGTTTATGTYSVTFKPPWGGSFKYRVLVVGNSEFANGYSAERWLTAN